MAVLAAQHRAPCTPQQKQRLAGDITGFDTGVGLPKSQGVLRDDVTAEEVAFVIWSQAGIIRATRTVAPNAWRRHLLLMLDTSCSTPSAPSVPTNFPSRLSPPARSN